LLGKPTPRNLNLGSDRFAMFNKNRDIPAHCALQLTIKPGAIAPDRPAMLCLRTAVDSIDGLS
jgi:hypothetical protein